MHEPAPAAATIEPELTRCTTWREVRKWLESFPAPRQEFGELDFERQEWVYRGVTDSRYPLEPSIERRARRKVVDWAALEKIVIAEFKSRAQLHLTSASMPDDELGWLALMQHYRIPTRLLDFTFSPFVALYFAVQEHCACEDETEKRTHIRVWAIDAPAVNNQFYRVRGEALRAAHRREKKTSGPVSMHPRDFLTAADLVSQDLQLLQEAVSEALTAKGPYRWELKNPGAVAAASPSSFNPRLANQQGAFLVNCAESLALSHSLERLMAPVDSVWCKAVDIPIDLSSKIEERLFQMNIHGQSLFPDLEGLARLIEEKTRFQWL